MDHEEAIVAGDEGVDIGPITGVAFSRVETDASGIAHASFITDDGEAFSLDHEALEARIAFLEREKQTSHQERRALRALVG